MICSIDGCRKPARIRGWCGAHYERFRRHGDPLGGRTPNGEHLRFLNEVVMQYEGDECLIWPYPLTPKGYVRIEVGTNNRFVHRLVCEAINGPPPSPEHETAHSCGKGHLGCVTKGHLSWKTHGENQADKIGHGTSLRGSLNPNAKLTEEDIRNIIALKGILSTRKIGSRHNIASATVSNIHRGLRWGWLGDGAPKPEAAPARLPVAGKKRGMA